MVYKNFGGVLEEAVQKLLEMESTANSAEPYRYAKTVFAAFERIQALREKGIRLIKICKAFEESGLLPQNANPRCFCQAFRREKARRGKNVNSSTAQIDKTEHGKTEYGKVKNTDDKVNPEQTATRLDETARKESRKERIKELTGTVVDSGLGKIIKHTDGSFEY